MGSVGSSSGDHVGGWPNTAAFNSNYEQREPVQLVICGSIPAYAAGTLYRSGPRGYKVPTNNPQKQVEIAHWFDGLSVLHRFQLLTSGEDKVITRVVYNSRSTTDALLEKIRDTGRADYMSFAQKRDPCQSIFSKLFTNFTAPFLADDPTHSSENLGVTLALTDIGSTTGKVELISKSDIAKFQTIDPETLEPKGIAQQTILHPELTGQLSATHARSDPETGDVFNYNLSLGFRTTYRVFRTSAATGQTTILAEFSAQASYIHSFFLTKRFVVLCVWNAWIKANGLALFLYGNMLDCIKRGTSRSDKARWYVIDRVSNRGLVKAFESEPFFAFHTVNAWDEVQEHDKSTVDIVAEVAIYNDTEIMHNLYYEAIVSNSPKAQQRVATLGASIGNSHARFRLPNIPLSNSNQANYESDVAHIVYNVDSAIAPELPTINPRFISRPHRYTYGIAFRGAAFADTLLKFDSLARNSIAWQESGCTPGEAIFIPRPSGSEKQEDMSEDDGVLLSIVLNGFTERSFLLCLDAKTMTEVGRAEVPGAIGLGFHGTFASTNGSGEKMPES